MAKLQESVKKFQQEIASLKTKFTNDLPLLLLTDDIPANQLALANSIFRTFPIGDWFNEHTGFVFKTTYQGKEEIFGVIAQHTLPWWYALRFESIKDLDLLFVAEALVDGQIVRLSAKVVQMTVPNMADIALIKFRPEDEQMLTPLTLAEDDPLPNELLRSAGFAMRDFFSVHNTPLRESTLFSLRFPIIEDSSGLIGMCGSPVLNKEGKVVGVFTGKATKNGEIIGFATRIKYLKTLVNAYHGETKGATFPIVLGGHTMAHLRVSEYIAVVTITTTEGEKIVFKVGATFPYSQIEKQLSNAVSVTFDIEDTVWKQQILQPVPRSLRKVVYHLPNQ